MSQGETKPELAMDLAAELRGEYLLGDFAPRH